MISLFYHFGRLRNEAPLQRRCLQNPDDMLRFVMLLLHVGMIFLNPIFSLFSVSLDTPKYQNDEGMFVKLDVKKWT